MFLMDDTIKSNITFGSKKTNNLKVNLALKKANLLNL